MKNSLKSPKILLSLFVIGGFVMLSHSKSEFISNLTPAAAPWWWPKRKEDFREREIELTVQTELRKPLSDVNVEFKSRGALENSLTDSNGYVKIKIPETEVKVTLRKNGFNPLTCSIDLREYSTVARTYFLKETKELSSSLSVCSTATATVEYPSSFTLPTSSPRGKLKAECEDFGRNFSSYNEIIAVSNQSEMPIARFYVSPGGKHYVVCKIVQKSGELQLKYALPDDSLISRLNIKVYIDGNLRKMLYLDRGNVLLEEVDLTGASEYALDFSVSYQSDSDFVYILMH
jgi:hypothetical protein